MTKIAIIGAGLSGLACARALAKTADVCVFEKSRGVSGRMSTRRAKNHTFDHGAQYFTARSDRFKSFLAPLQEMGVVKIWHGTFAEIRHGKITQTREWNDEHPHYVGVPGMNFIGKHLSSHIDVTTGVRITQLIRKSEHWFLGDEQSTEYGPFDWVISAIPPAQAIDILPSELADYTRIKNTQMSACYAVMLGFDRAVELPFNAAHVKGHDISWISLNSSKPERPENQAILIHSTNKYANEYIDADRDKILDHLISEASTASGVDLSGAPHKAIHGWRYANIAKQEGATHILDEKLNIGVCGDWFIEGRVEAAFQSGDALAQSLMDLI